MILPATTSLPERSFSKMKLTKTYLRSTMTQPRLNHFMILSIYPEKVDQLDFKSILEEFIRCKGHEKLIGKSESSGSLKTPMPELQQSRCQFVCSVSKFCLKDNKYVMFSKIEACLYGGGGLGLGFWFGLGGWGRGIADYQVFFDGCLHIFFGPCYGPA